MIKFEDLDLSNRILKGIRDMGFEEPTPIQAQAIPAIVKGKDVIGQAQTGTGKTCAFAIPAIEMLEQNTYGVQVLVLCPTRELAIQTAEEFNNVSKYMEDIRILPIYGGQSIERQITSLRKEPQIIIGTPGRIMDHMRRSTLKLDGIRMLVLDEADEMLSMGFKEDIDTILQKAPEEKQTVLFSATMSKTIMEISRKYLVEPVHVKIIHRELTVPGTDQYYIEVREQFKVDVLSRLIDGNNFSLSLVFCNTKKRVDELVSALQTRGYSAQALHGDMRQNERDAVMWDFRNGGIDILVATDVAARGIDVENIEAVINYDMPNDEEYYVHRIGRTGRAGKAGKAYTFIGGREFYKLRDIQRYTKTTITKIQPPTLFDIEKSKMGVLLKRAADVIHERTYQKYSPYVEQAVDEINKTDSGKTTTTLDVAAALLLLLSKQPSVRASRTHSISAPQMKYPKERSHRYRR